MRQNLTTAIALYTQKLSLRLMG